MARLRITGEDRKRRLSEGRKGWTSTRGMTAHEFIAWRERRAKEKKIRELEIKRKKDEDSRRQALANGSVSVRSGSPAGASAPRGSRLKFLIVVMITLLIIYLVLKYILPR